MKVTQQSNTWIQSKENDAEDGAFKVLQISMAENRQALKLVILYETSVKPEPVTSESALRLSLNAVLLLFSIYTLR